MKKTTLLLFLICGIAAAAQTTFSVLGDSYSTYAGHVTPAWNDIWYRDKTGGADDMQNDVDNVAQTWWSLLDSTDDFVLDTNNSWSGSTICLTGYDGRDFSDRAFITRMQNIGAPDVLLIFGGTNDSWCGAPIGEYKYADWINADLYAFRPAFAYLLANLKALYPEMKIVNILNSELKDEINESVAAICEHYGVTNIVLVDVDKQWGHPSQAGMQAIFNQVYDTLK